MILVDGTLYGCGCRLGGKAFFAVDFLTGKTLQSDKTLGKVSITCADGCLYAVNDKGQVSLVRLKPGGFEIVSQFHLPKESSDLVLCHPVVCGGRLYLRHDKNLYVYHVRAE